MNTFPNELTTYIFSFLDPKTLGTTEQVSKDFQSFTNDQWKNILASFHIDNSENISAKDFFKNYIITKEEDILEKYEEFFYSLNNKKNKGSLKCSFLISPEFKIEINFEPEKINNDTKEQNLHVFFAKKFDTNCTKKFNEKIRDLNFFIKCLCKYKVTNNSVLN